tara:strand:+ start:132 stop:1055 length:924 start_codon:yes stop_codon:yes gene_type:complete
MEIKFTKYHGAGNDYIAIDGRKLDLDWGQLSKEMSEPHFGVYSDGIVVVENPTVAKTDGGYDSVADIRMRVFNPDGSEAEMSGNGVRLFSKFVLDNLIVELSQWTKSTDCILVETGGGVRKVYPQFENRFNRSMVSAKVAMGEPRFLRDEIPLNKELISENIEVQDFKLDLDDEIIVNCVNIGNPHAVMITDVDIDEIDLERIGPLVENNNLFPNRVNFEIVNIISRDEIRARIFERGAGETLSSGTGTSACGIICIKKGLVNENVKVNVPGGFLNISWVDGKEVYLDGPTEKVFSGIWELGPQERS